MLVSTYIALYTFDSNPNEAPSSCGQCSRSSSHRETFPNQWNTWIRDQPRVTAKVHFGKRGGFDDGHSKLEGTGSTVATPPLNRRRSSLPPWERRHRTLAGDSDDEGKDGQKIGMKLVPTFFCEYIFRVLLTSCAATLCNISSRNYGIQTSRHRGTIP